MANSAKYAAAHPEVPKTEAQVLLACKNRLDWLERIGKVIWWDRIQAGTININGRWIKLGRSGMSDLVAYSNKNNIIYVFFFEVKANEKSPVSVLQKEFAKKWDGITNCKYKIVTHPNQIENAIDEIQNQKI